MIAVTDPGVEIDTAGWPVVVQRVGSRIAADEMTAYLRGLSDLFERKQPFANVVIVKQRGDLDFSALRTYGAFAKARAADMRAYYRAVAFVLPSDVFRIVLSAILSVTPSPVPYKVFSDQRAGYDWACGELRRIGVTPPSTTPVLWP